MKQGLWVNLYGLLFCSHYGISRSEGEFQISVHGTCLLTTIHSLQSLGKKVKLILVDKSELDFVS